MAVKHRYWKEVTLYIAMTTHYYPWEIGKYNHVHIIRKAAQLIVYQYITYLLIYQNCYFFSFLTWVHG